MNDENINLTNTSLPNSKEFEEVNGISLKPLETTGKPLSCSVKPENPVPQGISLKEIDVKTPERTSHNLRKSPRIASSRSSPRSCSTRSSYSTTSSVISSNSSKHTPTHDTISRVADLKLRWAKEREIRISKFRQQKEEERITINSASNYASESRKKNIDKQVEYQTSKKKEVKNLRTNILTTTSMESKEIDYQQKENRRKSFAIRANMAKEAKRKEKEINDKQKEYEASLFEDRKFDYLAIKEAKLLEAMKRRQSMAIRVEVAKKHKEFEENKQKQAKIIQKDIADVRSDLWKKNLALQKTLAAKARTSIAIRVDTWRTHKQQEMQQKNEKLQQIKEEVELKKGELEDVTGHKQRLVEEERGEILRRSDEWRREQEYLEQVRREQVQAISYEAAVRDAERKDVQEHKTELEKSLRDSLQFAADMAKQSKQAEEASKATEMEQRETNRLLAAEDRLAVSLHKQILEEERRQSLAFRVQQESLFRARQAKRGLATKNTPRKDSAEELKRKEAQAAASLKREMEEKERFDAKWNLEQARRSKEAQLKKHRDLLDRLHEDFEARKMDYMACAEEKKERQRRSRQSLSFRLESWSKHKQLEQSKMLEKKLLEQEEASLKAEDVESVREARRENQVKDKANTIVNTIGFLI